MHMMKLINFSILYTCETPNSSQTQYNINPNLTNQ